MLRITTIEPEQIIECDSMDFHEEFAIMNFKGYLGRRIYVEDIKKIESFVKED